MDSGRLWIQLHKHNIRHQELEINFLEATHSKDRKRAGFIFLTVASLHRVNCSLHDHVQMRTCRHFLIWVECNFGQKPLSKNC